MTNQLPPDAYEGPSEAELSEQQYERTIADLKERLAMRNAAAVLYGTHLERMVEAFDEVADCGIDGARVVEAAKKALGRPYDADVLNEYGQDGAF